MADINTTSIHDLPSDPMAGSSNMSMSINETNNNSNNSNNSNNNNKNE